MDIGHKVFSGIGRHKDISRRLAPYGFDWNEVFHQGKTERFSYSLAVNVARQTNVGASEFKKRLSALVCDSSLPFDAELNTSISRLGDGQTSAHDLARIWQILVSEAARLATLRPALSCLRSDACRFLFRREVLHRVVLPIIGWVIELSSLLAVINIVSVTQWCSRQQRSLQFTNLVIVSYQRKIGYGCTTSIGRNWITQRE